MCEFVFVILHYKNYRETIKCVESILILDLVSVAKIIVYDNGSLDESAELIRSTFSKDDRITVIESKIADGFSRGNNKAFIEAKKLNPHYMLFLNNDIVIRQRDFLVKLSEIGKNDKYQVIGPDIYAPRSAEHQSPLYSVFPSKEKLEFDANVLRKRKKDTEKTIIWEKRRLSKNRIKQYLPSFVIQSIRLMTRNKVDKDWKNTIENPVLSGSFLIFNRAFIDEVDVPFFPETKFFYEELILAERCRRLGFKTVYSPEIKAYHYHGISTLKSHSSMKNYVDFKYSNMVNSYEVFKAYLENE